MGWVGWGEVISNYEIGKFNSNVFLPLYICFEYMLLISNTVYFPPTRSTSDRSIDRTHESRSYIIIIIICGAECSINRRSTHRKTKTPSPTQKVVPRAQKQQNLCPNTNNLKILNTRQAFVNTLGNIKHHTAGWSRCWNKEHKPQDGVQHGLRVSVSMAFCLDTKNGLMRTALTLQLIVLMNSSLVEKRQAYSIMNTLTTPSIQQKRCSEKRTS